MKNLIVLSLLTFSAFAIQLIDGPVNIGDRAKPDDSAVLQIESTTGGFLPPRMTSTQRDAIPTPVEGLQIYNTTTGSVEFFSGGVWTAPGGGGSDHPLWTTSTAYGVGTIIVDGLTFKVYRNNTAHTSDATALANDIALGYWDRLAPTDNETVTGVNFQDPERLDVKKDTEANLTTYAATASDGQLVFATDTQKLYQIIGNALVPAGGGLSKWAASTAYSTDEVVWYETDNNIYVANSDFTSGGTFNPANWTELSVNLKIASSTDNAITRWDGTTGEAIQDSNVTVSDTGAISTPGDVTAFAGTAKEFELGDEIFETMSTGVDSFAGLAINASTTTFDVGAATGHIIDIAGDNYYMINFAGQTNIAPSTANGVTYVLIDNTGAVSLQTTLPTPNDRRTKMFLGRVVTVGGTVVQVQDTPSVFLESTNQTYDLADAIRIFNIEGNILSPNGTNLNINKTPGKIFSVGANFTSDPLNPHQISIGGATPASFAYITRAAGSTGTTTSAIDPNSYDAAGVVTTIPGSNSQATIQRVYLFPSGNIRIAYGQTVYSNLTEALQNVSIEGFVENPNIAGNGILIGFVVVKKNATDLSSSSQARVLLASRFGEGSIGAAGVSVSTMQNTYDNSTQPQITVNATQGGVQVRDASTPIADSLLEVQNNAGTTNYLDVAAEFSSVEDRDGRFVLRPDRDIVYYEDFKENDQTTVTLTGTGTLAVENTNPLRGSRSLSYTQDGAGSSGATITKTGIAIDEALYGNLVGLFLDIKASADLAAGYQIKFQASSDDVTYRDIGTVDVDVETINTPVQLNRQLLSTDRFIGYEIEVLVSSASHEIIVDDITFVKDPLPIVQLGNIQGATEYTPTIVSTNTVTDNTSFYYRVGDKVKITGYALFGSSGTGNLTFSLPSGVLFDTTKLPTTNSAFAKIGEARWYNASAPSLNQKLWVVYNDDDKFFFKEEDGTTFDGTFLDNGDTVYFDFEAPVQGWRAEGDNIITQQTVTEGEWQAIASPTTSWSNVAVSASKRKIGENYEYQYEINCNSGAPTGGALTLNLPAGDVIDTSKLISSGGTNYEELGSGNALDNGTNTFTNKVLYNNTTSVVVFNELSGSTYLVNQNQTTPTVPFTFTTGDKVVVKFSVPIVGLGAIEKNVTVISPLKTEITTGTEYQTGEVIDSKPVYEYVYEVPSDITSTATIVSNPVGIVNPVGILNDSGTVWTILRTTAGTDVASIFYDRSNGNIEGFISGTGLKIGAGTVIRFKYTK